MISLHPQIITDTAGKQLVVLSMKEYKNILEELEDIKLYDKAKIAKEPAVEVYEAFEAIEAKR